MTQEQEIEEKKKSYVHLIILYLIQLLLTFVYYIISPGDSSAFAVIFIFHLIVLLYISNQITMRLTSPCPAWLNIILVAFLICFGIVVCVSLNENSNELAYSIIKEAPMKGSCTVQLNNNLTSEYSSYCIGMKIKENTVSMRNTTYRFMIMDASNVSTEHGYQMMYTIDFAFLVRTVCFCPRFWLYSRWRMFGPIDHYNLLMKASYPLQRTHNYIETETTRDFNSLLLDHKVPIIELDTWRRPYCCDEPPINTFNKIKYLTQSYFLAHVLIYFVMMLQTVLQMKRLRGVALLNVQQELYVAS